MPASSSGGRRAAQATAGAMENDQIERDASLRKVEARDLVEFGMIPVSERRQFPVARQTDHLTVSFVYFDRNSSAAFPYWSHSTA